MNENSNRIPSTFQTRCFELYTDIAWNDMDDDNLIKFNEWQCFVLGKEMLEMLLNGCHKSNEHFRIRFGLCTAHTHTLRFVNSKFHVLIIQTDVNNGFFFSFLDENYEIHLVKHYFDLFCFSMSFAWQSLGLKWKLPRKSIEKKRITNTDNIKNISNS